jgi:streptogramin lyase
VRRTVASWWGRAALALVVALALAVAGASSAQAVSITEFSSGLSSKLDGPIAEGPEGNMWFATDASIGRITPSGQITEFKSGLNPGSSPFDIALGADGNLWFTDNGTTKALGRVTPSGTITEFSTGLKAGSAPLNVTSGPDGNVWFLDLGTTKAIGRVTPGGKIDEFTTGLPPVAQMNDITDGPDGNVWFTEEGNTRGIGRVTPSGEIKVFTRMLNPLQSFPAEITTGADGNLWFSDDGEPLAVGRVTPAGTITDFGEGNGLQMNGAPDALTAGPDGNVWFTDQYAGQRAVGRITPAGVITEFSKGLGTGLPDDIALGADGNLWIEQSMPGGIARITPSGAITQFTAGLNPEAGQDGDAIVSGPNGTLWFTDRGTPNAIGRVALELPLPVPLPIIEKRDPTTGGSPSVTPTSEPTPVPLLTAATVGDQQIKLTTPSSSVCTASKGSLAVTFSSSAIAHSRAAKLRFSSAAFFIDRGVKRKLVKRVHGKRKTVTVYAPNAILHRASGSPSLHLTGLGSGQHALKAIVTYKKTVSNGHSKRTVAVIKTLTAKFRVC